MTPRPTYKADLPLVEANTPAALKTAPQWVIWRFDWNDKRGEWAKVPYNARTLFPAKSNDAATWSTYAEAVDAFGKLPNVAGVGFMLTPGFVGVDLDDCRDASGIKPWAREILEAFNTYSEVSPSETGVKLFLRANADNDIGHVKTHHDGQVEVYWRARWFAVTGNAIEDYSGDVEDRQAEFDRFYGDMFGGEMEPIADTPAVPASQTAGLGAEVVRQLLSCPPRMQEQDGSRRLVVWCKIAKGLGATAQQCVEAIRISERVPGFAFPARWSDLDILSRFNDAKIEPGVNAPDATIEPIALGDLWQSDPTLREPMIDGLLRVGQVGNLISTSKSYKTFLMLGLAVAMTQRRAWLGVFPTTGGRVLYVDMELQKPDITKRTREIASGMHAPLAEVGQDIDILSLRGRNASIDKIEPMLMGIEPGTYSLLILDPLYKLYPEAFDENSNAQMTALYRRFERIAEHLQAAVLIVHHASKGSQADKRVTDVGSGASAQSRAPDCHIALREHEVDDCVVFDAKVRSFRPVESFVMRWQYPLWERDLSLDPASIKTGRRSRNTDRPQPQPKEKPEPWTVDRFVSTFLNCEPVGKSIIKVMAPSRGTSARQALDLLDAAVTEGKAHVWTGQDGRTKTYSTKPQPLIQPLSETPE